MPESKYSFASSDLDTTSIKYYHFISEAGRLLPSASRWNSIEIDFNMFPKSSSNAFDSIPSRFSKSVDFNLIITDKKYFNRFLQISVSILLSIIVLCLLLRFLPHKHKHHGSSKNLTLALNQALVFFDAQKSGPLPKNRSIIVKFRGNSGLEDGNGSDTHANLVGGFYDSGNNIKFSLPTAYTTTLLSWSVIEYHEKYNHIGELEHVKDIIKWGSDYLLKLFIPANSTSDPGILYSQVGSGGNDTSIDNDINCWQRPEDMAYPRPVSQCTTSASDLAGEIVAALSAASLVFKEDKNYSSKLIETAKELFNTASREDVGNEQGTYTMDTCGAEAMKFYNSSGYKDELVWGGTWLSFATGNISHLQYATDKFPSAVDEELSSEKGLFYWNNKISAIGVLLTRLRYFRDLGYPYESALQTSSNMTDLLMCSYLSQNFKMTPGGLILLRSNNGAQLQFAATASFLTKLYSDYLALIHRSGGSCSDDAFSVEMLRSFSRSQVNYILGDNPTKMSYVVGFGKIYPTHVHHRGASIPSDNKKRTCEEGDKWLNSKDQNPNTLLGAMVAGPDQDDNFVDERDKPWFTEPTISSNAGLVAALIALHDPPSHSSNYNGVYFGMDELGIFENISPVSS